jgi:molybdopterin molybdotransferase
VSESADPGFERRHADWLGVAQASSRVLAAARPLAPERVRITDALGRALAEDLTSTVTLPPWDNSAMDGYAVRGEDVASASEDAPVALRLVGRIRAGEPSRVRVGPGQAVRIMTGAPIPDGADSVIRVEDTDAESTPGSVRVRQNRDRGRHVRPAGQDMRPDERMLCRGDAIGPGTVGVLAALGTPDVAVCRRPVVAILTTGDELRGPDRYDDVRSGHGVPESNGPMLAAAVAAAGGIPLLLDVGSDDEVSLKRCIRSGAGADVLVTVGGASMGEADLVKRVLEKLGFDLGFWRVRMRPGSPFSFGHLPGERLPQPVFGLPGNPASAFVTFEVLVRPFLLKMAGHKNVHRMLVRCTAGSDLRGADGLTVFARVVVSRDGNDLRAVPAGAQSSGLVRGLAATRGLAVVRRDAPTIPPGAPVDVLLLDDMPGSESTPAWGESTP